MPVDLRGLFAGESHRFGIVHVKNHPDIWRIGVFESAEFKVPVSLSSLPDNCLLGIGCSLACFEKATGNKVSINSRYRQSVGSSGIYENGIATLGFSMMSRGRSEVSSRSPITIPRANTSFIPIFSTLTPSPMNTNTSPDEAPVIQSISLPFSTRIGLLVALTLGV